jgi:plastocyanin
MRILQRRSFGFTAGAVAIASLTLLIMAPRPMFRPPPRPMMFRPPPRQVAPMRFGPAFRSTLPARPPALGRLRPDTTISVNRSGFNGSSFNFSRTFGNNSISTSLTRSGPFGSAQLLAMLSLTGSPNNILTLSRSLTLNETLFGHTANFSANSSVNLTAAQLTAAILGAGLRHSQLAALRQTQLMSLSPNSAYLRSTYPGYPYMSSGYGGMGYGGGGSGYSAGMGGQAPPAPQFAGYQQNRPAPEEKKTTPEDAVTRVLAASGVTDDNGQPLWPVGLKALPGTRAAQLRDRVNSLLSHEEEEAAAGTVTEAVYRDLISAVDALGNQLLRDREERFSLTYQAYEDAEDYLAKLKQVAKQLQESAALAAREVRATKPGADKAVSMIDKSFSPQMLEVAAGTTVHWMNNSQHKHTVTSDKGDWGSKELGPGDAYSYKFSQPGTYPYHCEVHAKEMRGTVVVK